MKASEGTYANSSTVPFPSDVDPKLLLKGKFGELT